MKWHPNKVAKSGCDQQGRHMYTGFANMRTRNECGWQQGRRKSSRHGIWESDDESKGSSIDKIDQKSEQKQLVD